MHEVDTFSFLTICPLILFAQIIVCITYAKNSQLRVKPGSIFFGLVIIELALNVHLLATAGKYRFMLVYRIIFSANEPMPPSFIPFCLSMSFIETFFSMLHFMYLILFMFHTIFLFRFSLKKSTFESIQNPTLSGPCYKVS